MDNDEGEERCREDEKEWSYGFTTGDEASHGIPIRLLVVVSGCHFLCRCAGRDVAMWTDVSFSLFRHFTKFHGCFDGIDVIMFIGTHLLLLGNKYVVFSDPGQLKVTKIHMIVKSFFIFYKEVLRKDIRTKMMRVSYIL